MAGKSSQWCRLECIDDLLSSLKWIGLNERWNSQMLILLFKCLKGSAPMYLSSQFNFTQNTHSHGTRSQSFISLTPLWSMHYLNLPCTHHWISATCHLSQLWCHFSLSHLLQYYLKFIEHNIQLQFHIVLNSLNRLSVPKENSTNLEFARCDQSLPQKKSYDVVNELALLLTSDALGWSKGWYW